MSDERQSWAPRDPTTTVPGRAPGAGVPDAKGTKRKRPKRTGWRRLLPTWRMALGGFILLALLLVGGFVVGYKLVSIPPANAAAVAQSNVFLYSDGSEIARTGKVNRENIQLAQVPKSVQHAVLAAEDRGFYNEPAVDPEGMARAAFNTLSGKGTQGGSTITQQYVKNYYLNQEQTVSRKIKEFFIAIKLNREETKNQILQGYLNTSYFGRNAYGIQAAAQAYYNKDIDEISTSQGAYLASLLNAPSELDVVAHPENKPAAVARWNYVLNGMVKEHWLSPSARATMTFPTPDRHANPAITGLSGQRGYLVQAVEDYLTSNKIIDENTLARGGYRITTTLQPAKQNDLVKAVTDNITSKLNKKLAVDRDVRVGAASVDPQNGDVVAMYGGIDYTKQFVNNATRRDFQVGSTFKAFVFAAAVQNGSKTQSGEKITPNTIYNGDNEREVVGPNGPTGYAPSNEDNVDYGPITVRTATEDSVNAVYAQMAEDVGPSVVRRTAVDLGIPNNTPDLTATPSIALGPSTPSVLDMAGAYATLANHGEHTPYTLVAKVTKNGQSITLPHRASKQVISREAADTTTSLLQSVVDGDGTGTAAQAAGRPAAGKTGTAEDDKAALFAGYTPNLATVVSMMGANPTTAVQEPLYGALGQARINGGGPPAQVWGQYTAAALEGTTPLDFHLQLQPGAQQTITPSDEGTDEENTPEDTGQQDTPEQPDTPPSHQHAQSPTTGQTPDQPQTPGQGGTTGGTTSGSTGGQNGGQNSGSTGTTGGNTGTTGGGTGTTGGSTGTGGQNGPGSPQPPGLPASPGGADGTTDRTTTTGGSPSG